MTGDQVEVHCTSCRQLVRCDTWHPCRGGVYRMVPLGAPQSHQEPLTVPRAVSHPRTPLRGEWDRDR